jgi:hypothetical protein
MIQNALTTIVPILPAKLPALTAYLETIGNDVENNPLVRFRGTPSTHFARWVILDDPRAPRLYFSTCYDGIFADYIREITENLGAGMEPIWTCCEGYPPHAAANPKAFTDFLTPYCLDPDIFLVSFPGLSARQIINNIAFRDRFDVCLDTAQTDPATHPSADATVLTASVPAAKSSASGYGVLADRIINWLVGVTPGAPAQNTITTTKKDLLAAEDRVVQNQMTIVSPVRKGLWPRLLLRFFLLMGHWFNKASPDGKLSGLSTIHFARWVLIDGGDMLLFESNYDGSWENYIDDFGDHAATGMNAVWGTSIGFPKGGCLDIEAFKNGIRRYQHPAQFFYSAYPNQTVRNIASDLRLRQDLGAAAPFMSGALV